MSFQRARTDDQIQERIAEIVNAAAAIYDEHGYDNLTFSAISEITKFTRPTIYKYFSTKEEILLKILVEDTHKWVDKLVASFKINKLYDIKEISEIWTNSLSTHKRLIELYSILFTILEKNSSKEALVSFKTTIMSHHNSLYELVSQLFPNASSSQITYFLNMQSTLLIGLYPMSNLSEIQLEAIELSKTRYVSPNFEVTYKNIIFQIMYCIENNIDLVNQ